MTVLNQVRPSSLSCKKSFSARAICLGLGAADIVAGRALRRMRPSQTGWKGEAGPSPTPRARSMGSSRAPWQHGQLKSAMATGWPGSARGNTCCDGDEQYVCPEGSSYGAPRAYCCAATSGKGSLKRFVIFWSKNRVSVCLSWTTVPLCRASCI